MTTERRIAIAGIIHETNTYCRDQTPLSDFHIMRGAKMLQLEGTETQTGGAIGKCHELGLTPVPVYWANTQPSGTIAADAYDSMKAELLEGLSAVLPVDGVFLDLHGAGVVDGTPDLEGDLAASVRRLVGEGVPVTAAFDLHGNVTQDMADALDGVFVCHEYPHIDQHLRAREAVQLINDMMDHGFRPSVQVSSLPMLMPTTTTFHGPGKTLKDFMRALEADANTINVSFFHGFPYCDVPHVGSHLVVTSRTGAEHAKHKAERAAAKVWSMRELLRPTSLSAEEAVAQAIASDKHPVVINETSDNCGGGSPGDGTHLARAILESGVANACFGFIVDAEVAEQAHQAGVGAIIDVSLGGKHDKLHGEPLNLRVYVKALHDGRCIMQAMAKGSRINYGKLARLQPEGSDKLDIVVGSRRSQTFDTEPFLAVGIDVMQRHVVGLKSSNHFRAGFELIAGEIITADPPGLTTHHIEVFPREHVSGSLWPLEDV
ncbi:MAG: M81 family metallopeptidase [Pseudomonadales bacterium]|nr:M81 family metallopeptidase [Pseudomonadales bacterium]MBO6594895.1 M81 family metallopeptidase [Pseudomonadales bacterium]MBO6701401.1 M81 family metallopeptidase [Pseudomonadales bacterium]MBO6821545.1 M81 family metallopeptidase [Pseudomonadales bacterium]MBO7005631.1 M81 family metallopeptidase [Pseudomonadales bacterium]